MPMVDFRSDRGAVDNYDPDFPRSHSIILELEIVWSRITAWGIVFTRILPAYLLDSLCNTRFYHAPQAIHPHRFNGGTRFYIAIASTWL